MKINKVINKNGKRRSGYVNQSLKIIKQLMHPIRNVYIKIVLKEAEQ